MKHGPIALVEEGTPVVVVLPSDAELWEKTVSNLTEVRARGAFTVAIGPRAEESEADLAFPVAADDELGLVLGAAVHLQLLAYHVAAQLGCEIDRPRNLAKSVTVE
jgi:glucosamine--fructose-6-phosphate aminotransferase (isomerizing)